MPEPRYHLVVRLDEAEFTSLEDAMAARDILLAGGENSPENVVVAREVDIRFSEAVPWAERQVAEHGLRGQALAAAILAWWQEARGALGQSFHYRDAMLGVESKGVVIGGKQPSATFLGALRLAGFHPAPPRSGRYEQGWSDG